MDWKNLHTSKTFRGIIIGICTASVALFIFEAGVFVGYKKAAFSYRLGDNYYRAFRGNRDMPMMPGLDSDDLPTSHGAVGKIIKISLPTMIIDDKDGVEKTIIIKKDTIIKRFQETVLPENMRPDEFAVIIGSPNNNSEIEAKLIRLLPSPSNITSTTTTQ